MKVICNIRYIDAAVLSRDEVCDAVAAAPHLEYEPEGEPGGVGGGVPLAPPDVEALIPVQSPSFLLRVP